MNILANRRASGLRTFFSITIAAIWAASVSPTWAATSTLNPTADAYVRAGTYATTNYGTATTLTIGTNATTNNNYDSYLKFDTTSVPNITTVKLRLYAALSAAGSIASTAYPVAITTWGETTLNWNNKPARGTALGNITVTSTSYAWYEIDVTAYVQSEYNAGRKVVSFAWHNSANTTPTITAQSKEGSNKPQLLITYNAAPTVSLTAPANNSTFNQPANLTLTATAADSDGSISKVEFYNGTTLLGTDTTSPYSTTWTNAPAGSYSLTAKAYDNQNATTTSTAVSTTVNASPTVSLTAPAASSVFATPANITITATATDTDGTLSKVEFYKGTTLLGIDTTAPYSYTWANAPAGSYSLTAKAYDNLNAATTSAAVTINVTAAPTVSLTAPANNSIFNQPANITLTATAADSDGTVSKVEFYNGATLLGTDTTAPYSTTWNNAPAGSYSLTAKATDNLGATTTSAAVAMTVNAPPTVSLTAPANNSLFTPPATLILSATAADSDGTVSKVEFYNGTTLLGTDTTAPYGTPWNNVPAGSYTLSAKAYDNRGAITTSTAVTVNVTAAPTVSLTAPANNSIFNQPANITLTATDSDGTISKVDFYNGTTLLGTAATAPYSYNWSNVAAGSYDLSAQATDNLGATTTSSAVNITVNASMVSIDYTYDEIGRLTGMADDTGIAAQYTYDALGNIVSIQRFAGSAVTLIDFTPDTGAAGSQVTITGTGFSATPSLNTVNFNTLSAAVVSATTTRLVVNVPAGVTTGPISVTSPSGSATSSTNFVVNALAPTIASFSPAIGPTGTAVTISGANFQADLFNNKVSINGAPLKVTAATSTSMTAVVPSSIGSGKIKVTTPNGSALSVADYYYTPSPYTAADVEIATRMDNPGAKTITITTPGKVAMVLFEGVANQRVGLFLSDVTIPTGTVTIYAPNGSVYASTSAGTSGGSIGVTTLPSTGTYAILVAPASSGTGNITLNIGVEDLVISNVSTGTLVLNANGSYTFPVTYTVTNAGAVTAQPTWYDTAHLSTDGVLDDADQALDNLNIRGAALAPGGSYTVTVNYTTSTTTAGGNYTLFIKTDGRGSAVSTGTATDSGYVSESDEANNVAALAVTLTSP